VTPLLFSLWLAALAAADRAIGAALPTNALSAQQEGEHRRRLEDDRDWLRTFG
jgi:hypothetical protein